MTTTPQPSPVALVTGASRGLGRSAALHLARAGVGVIGTYASDKGAADSLQAEIEQDGGTAAVLHLDAGRSDTFPDFAAELRDVLSTRFGRTTIDHLVNNAGLGGHTPYLETTEEQYDELFAVNVKGPFFLTQALAPMIADGGRVLNVSSGLARFTRAGASAYAATKGAIEVLTRYQAVELGSRGIRVNVVVPGAVATDFNGAVLRDTPALQQTLIPTIALGRIAEADDIGAAIPLILAGGLGWATGSRIELSGGQSL